MDRKTRGKILRDTSLGPGLIIVEGRQYPFDLEGTWKSDCVPKADMTVEVEFAPDGLVSAIYHVTESQLAKEQARQAAELAKEKGAELVGDMLARFGAPTLITMAALVAGWFFLNTLSVQISSTERIGISFWKILAVVNSPSNLINALGYGQGDGAGMYGFLAIIALVAPLAPYFWKDPRAHLGNLLPLAFMFYVGVTIYWGIHDSARQAQGAMSAFGGAQAAEMAAEMAAALTKEALKAFSIGLGAYLSFATSIYLAAKGAIKFLATRA